MELLILDTTLKAVDMIDIFDSVIWADRYNGYGDFEIYTPVSEKILTTVKHDYFLWIKESEYGMIVEDVQITSDFENGNKLVITGRSLESMLDRRIIWNKTILTGNLQNGIKKLLDENIIDPSDADRQIPNFIFRANTDPLFADLVNGLQLEAQFMGQNLYDVIVNICEVYGIGFKVLLLDDNTFEFSLYDGVDRTYNQLLNPYVIFSPKFENIINSNYLESKKTLRTVTLVAGEEYDTTKDDVEAALDQLVAGGGTFVDVGAGVVRKTIVVAASDIPITDLSRREMFSDAKDISQRITVDGREEMMSDAQYFQQLASRGESDLSEKTMVQTFEGEVETSHTFIYGVDYFLGDKVQIVNEYGIESVIRVTEIVYSQSLEGIKIHPTFSKI
jgi:hypothetical protein